MSSVYNKAFKVGVVINLVVFAILNAVSFVAKKRAYDASSIRLSPGGFDWGHPFAWFWDAGIGLGFMLNFAVITFFSFVAGFVFRFLGKR